MPFAAAPARRDRPMGLALGLVAAAIPVILLWATAGVGCGRLGYGPSFPSLEGGPADASLDRVLVDAPADATRDDRRMDAGPADAVGLDAPTPDAPPVDARREDRPVQDAPADVPGVPRPPCAAITDTWTLTAPEALTALNSSGTEGDMFLLPDGLTLYYSSGRPGGQGAIDVWRTTRPRLDGVFGAPVNESFNTTANELRLVVSDDLLWGVLNRDNGNPDLFLGHRARATDPWGTFEAITAVNTSVQEWDPWLSPDGLRLYFMSWNSGRGPGGKDLFISERASLGAPFGAPREVPGVNTPMDEGQPAFSRDERFLVYANDSAGAGDLYWSYRATRDGTFVTPVPLPVVNLPDRYEGEPYLSPDGCELYFVSDRVGGAGGWDIYRSHFVPMR